MEDIHHCECLTPYIKWFVSDSHRISENLSSQLGFKCKRSAGFSEERCKRRTTCIICSALHDIIIRRNNKYMDKELELLRLSEISIVQHRLFRITLIGRKSVH